ncbi:hypothetical protein [Paenibacillus medicaginis]|uniref:Uncharacterized protein n=1 Tax=Paenibacillus medicaginis TaxID=1470560 RepID=A0ABV5BUX5_9BACL
MSKAKNEVNEVKNNKKQCISCNKLKIANTSFFLSNSDFHADSRFPVCKECLKKNLNTNDLNNVKDLLLQMNRPFIYDLWQSSLEEASKKSSEPFGIYLKSVVLNHRDETWKHSIMEPTDLISEIDQPEKRKSGSEFTPTDKITNEIIDKWGIGYSNDEYRAFEKKYKRLINNYGEKTALHTEGLITYIRYRVKEEMATAKGEVKEAKEWGTLASKAAQDAKINVSQLSKSDISGGVDVLAQLFEAVESEVGIIPLLPKVLEQPYDDVDLVIWATVNYNRRLEDKPSVSYRDVWAFYDDMLEEHFGQQGYNEDQIKEFKERRNNVFRDLGEVYKEQLYESDGE